MKLSWPTQMLQASDVKNGNAVAGGVTSAGGTTQQADHMMHLHKHKWYKHTIDS